MHRPAVFKVAADTDNEVIESSLFLLYGKKVGKSLGRVEMSSVTRIDNAKIEPALADAMYSRSILPSPLRSFVAARIYSTNFLNADQGLFLLCSLMFLRKNNCYYISAFSPNYFTIFSVTSFT